MTPESCYVFDDKMQYIDLTGMDIKMQNDRDVGTYVGIGLFTFQYKLCHKPWNLSPYYWKNGKLAAHATHSAYLFDKQG